MIGILNLLSSAVAYGDSVATSAPKRRFFDWSRNFQGIVVNNPKSEQYTIDPSSTLSIFNGSRTLTSDGTTAFAVTQSPLDPSIYRFTVTAGTSPGFRTDRALNVAGAVSLTFAVNSNGSVSVTASPEVVSTIFAAVQVGDTVLVPGLVTGDVTSPFDPMNSGQWIVLGVATRVLMLARPPNQIFSGANQVAAVTSNIQFSAFSAFGSQINDKVEISAGFSQSTQRSYTINNITPTYFEVVSTLPLALEAAILPGAAGLQIYKFSKRFLRVECDQEAAVQTNGDTGQLHRISPLVAGDPESMGWMEQWGPAWSLSVVNRSAAPMSVSIMSAE